MRRRPPILVSLGTLVIAVSAVIAPRTGGVFAQTSDGFWHLWSAPRFPWFLTGGDQGPPPPITPSTWHKFLVLIATYEKFGANIPVSFGEWILMNGVTDVREQLCLMWLWWNWTHQHAVD